MSFAEKIAGMMARSGKTYRQCCRMLGSKDGATAARNKRLRAAEVARQESMGLR